MSEHSRELRYAYGLRIDSELDLPELQQPPPAGNDEPDVRIRLGAVPSEGPAGASQLGPYLWAGPRQFWLHIPEVARFLVNDGCEIRVDPEPGIDDDSLRVFLLGSAFGALLFQRGLLVLHGNAIQVGDRAMICVGHSGAGKSTLAAAFLRRGYNILADDVVPVDAQCRALPGFPRIKLWQDTASRMQIDTAGLRRIRPGMEKFNFPVVTQFADCALPVRWIYILSGENQPDIQLDPVAGMDRFLPLRDNTYRVSFLKGMGLNGKHLRLIGQVAARIRLVRVTRPDHGFELDALVDSILADIAANP
ncbi:hypothetical protein [Solimonas sp. SE-A11]|uniref:hypothetical protein n=1 Tax=Solimonas sp. SE-A11 TaxID=3054954 RepID=UPI00259CD96A|nr:hypothetical protein [Solimonas sp. SE-A11]MDM4769032.1 hypothetical protein [Solimonas sp. SE-A11]